MDILRYGKKVLRQILPPCIWCILRYFNSLLNKTKHDTHIKVIRSIVELDQEIKKADEAALVSFDLLIEVNSQYKFEFDNEIELPHDTNSCEYKKIQHDVYLQISGRESYDAQANEHTPFDVELMRKKPFPYYTCSSKKVGEQLIAQGFLIKSMNLPANSKILEFGPGWGNTTLHFSQMGYSVTAVEISRDFCDLIQYRSSQIHTEINIVNTNMLEYQSNQKFDAVVFFECFHHCSDHVKMIEKLDSLVAENGIAVFAAEPIIDDFPQPWGIRLDGMSVWSIRKFGWLELGFNTKYFKEIMSKSGWEVETHLSVDCPWCRVFIARRKSR